MSIVIYKERYYGKYKIYKFNGWTSVSYTHLSLSKGKSNPQSLLHPFINAKSNEVIKEQLRTLYKKYNYTIEQNSKRFNNLYGMIISYKPEGKINQDMILAGYLRNNLIYEKVNKEDK